MKAAVYYGPNKVEVADVPEPEPTAGTVKVKVGFNGICGTDLHEYYAGPIFVPSEPHPLTGQALPLTIGHEFSGVITDVGPGVTGYSAGDRVAIEPVYRCGECAPCRAGNYNICQRIGFHGLMSDGGMAEYTVVPTNMLHRLPDNVSLELGALVEPMSVAYHAATLGEVTPGGHRGGLRCGPDRNRAVVRASRQAARDGVRGRAVRHAARRDRGTRRADTRPDAPSTCPRSSPITPTDAARMPRSTRRGWRPRCEAALASVGARRPTISVAIYEKPLATPLFNLVMNESRIQGSLCYTSADFEAVIALMAEGGYDTTGWVTPIAIDDVIDEGFEALHAGAKMKVLVDPTI